MRSSRRTSPPVVLSTILPLTRAGGRPGTGPRSGDGQGLSARMVRVPKGDGFFSEVISEKR